MLRQFFLLRAIPFPAASTERAKSSGFLGFLGFLEAPKRSSKSNHFLEHARERESVARKRKGFKRQKEPEKNFTHFVAVGVHFQVNLANYTAYRCR